MLLYQLCVILYLNIWNISNVIRISLIHVIVPLWMMAWSNALVYSCDCVCFVLFLLSCLVNVFFYVSCVVWCLLTCSIFRCNWCRDCISGMNICVCVCVCVYVFWSILSTKQCSITKYSEVANNYSSIADSVSNTLEDSTISAN
jgi:hypothetical protein